MSLKEISEQLRNSVTQQKEEYLVLLERAEQDEAEAVDKLRSPEAQTDKSENAVFQAAHDAYMKAQSDIAKYSTRLDLLKEYNPDYIPVGVIKVNTTVTFEILTSTGNFPNTYTMLLVPEGLGNASKMLLDVSTPVGKAIIEHQAGDTVSYTALSGNQKIRIKEIF